MSSQTIKSGGFKFRLLQLIHLYIHVDTCVYTCIHMYVCAACSLLLWDGSQIMVGGGTQFANECMSIVYTTHACKNFG